MDNLPTRSEEVTERPAHQKPHALMACETCRKRKRACDEQQPRCGFCQKIDVPCVYQEPKPTKRDNTLMLILRTLDSLNLKVDRVASKEDLSLLRNPWTPGTSPRNISTQLESFQIPTQESKRINSLLAWPAVQRLLECDGVNLSEWDGQSQGTESWLLSICKEFPRMAVDPSIDILYSDFGVLALDGRRSIYLNKSYVESLCAAYFRSYHCSYPILDPYHFYNDLLPRVCGQSFSEENEESALVLSVLALGSVAQEGATASSILDETGRETGIRGGTIVRPPGHILLMEAKRRLGIGLTYWNLNNLQCCILFAVYYAQVARNLDFLRMAILACSMCKSLVKIVESDQINRCFWICCIFEGGLCGEMGLELPSITALENSVPLPLFLSHFREHITKPGDELFIEYHFLAQITLRTLINRARESNQETKNPFHTTDQGKRPSEPVARELSRQLQNWRAHLPLAIAWDDESMEDMAISTPFPTDHQKEAPIPVDPALKGMLCFRTILKASLHTRYKYAEYIIWRPFIFRILHSPQDPAMHDVECCQKAFKACTLWPLTFATFHSQRRLIPHTYEYTHTFFGILLLFHVCSLSQILGPLLRSMPADVSPEVNTTLYLTWMRDMRVIHPVARWCWQLLKIVYKDHELVKGLEGERVQEGEGMEEGEG